MRLSDTSNFYERAYALSLSAVDSKGRSLWSITISSHDEKLNRDDNPLDIQFKISRYATQVAGDATISVLGLDKNTIDTITKTSSMTYIDAVNQRIRVTLYAGYKNNMPAIFSGYVVTAISSSPPDRWLTIEANSYVNFGEALVDQHFNDVTMDVIVRTLAKRFDRQMFWDVNTLGLSSDLAEVLKDGKKIKISEYHAKGTIHDILKQLSELHPRLMVIEDNGFFVVIAKFDAEPRNAYSITERSGLLNVSSVTYHGLSLAMALHDPVRINRWFSVSSFVMPHASGTYRLYKKKFEGHFYGEKWYTMYEGLTRDRPL